jgi:hypothetical protein
MPGNTPVAKRTRSLKRTASVGNVDYCEDGDLDIPKPLDKTLRILKAKVKKRKEKLSPE